MRDFPSKNSATRNRNIVTRANFADSPAVISFLSQNSLDPKKDGRERGRRWRKKKKQAVEIDILAAAVDVREKTETE